MSEVNIFEEAVRLNLRFDYKGSASVEDLWQLKLAELDKIYGKLKSEQSSSQKNSLLPSRSSKDKLVELRLAIVEHIFKVKVEEKVASETRVEKRQKKAKLMELLEDKQNENLKGKSVEDLQAMIDEL